MKKIYIDFTHSLPTKLAKFHGGGNYTKTILLDMKEYLSNLDLSYEIILLFPKDYIATSEIEKEILNCEKFQIKYISTTLDKHLFESGSILFLPLLGVKEFPLLKTIKGKYSIKIILTIHGLRLLDMKWDNYDLDYLDGTAEKLYYILKNKYLLYFRKRLYCSYLRRYTTYCDKLITVSNYSLASIMRYTQIKNIFLQYEDIIKLKELPIADNLIKEYILFVSGNRPEKNLSRTLDAYKYVYKSNKNIMPIFITGVSKKTQMNLSKSLILFKLIKEKKIVFLDYISDEQLLGLYKNASFLLYTSKSEGFGLPALEAAMRQCPVVAAYGTSIPEVLGSNAIYVDPYSVESIAYGIKKMLIPKTRECYKQKIEQSIPYIKERINESNKGLFEFIFT